MNVLTLLAVTPWLCQSPLELGSGHEILNPVTFKMTINADGRFEATGTEQDFTVADFTWRGSGIMHEGQYRMIGTQTYTLEDLPSGEIRGRTVHVEPDVFILDIRSSATDPIMIRCLPEEKAL